MSWLTIGGALTVSIARATAATTRRATIGRKRTGAATGDVNEARRASRWAWDVVTTPLPADEADSLENLLMGNFHVWDCDGSFSSSGGAGVTAVASDTVRFDWAGASPFTSRMRVASGGQLTLQGNLSGSDWSVLAVNVSSANDHYGMRSAGNFYKNGVDQGTPTPPGWFSTASLPNIALLGKDDGGTNALAYFGQVATFPWLLPDSHVAALTSWRTRKWPSRGIGDSMAPVFEVSGNFIPRTYAMATAVVKSGAYKRVDVDGAFERDRRVVAFTIRQAELAA